MREKKVLFITQAAMIAAVYVVLTVIFAPFSFGEVQVRISEALTILPYFTPAAIPGLFVGCIIGNITGGAILFDVIFGSLATLIGAVGSYALRKHKFLVPLPPIIVNMIVVPLILRFGYQLSLPLPLLAGSVGLGQIISCGFLGLFLLFSLKKIAGLVFKSSIAE